MIVRWIACFVCLLTYAYAQEENFLLIDGATGDALVALGPHIEERVTPCSTFKVPLSLMGYDAGILIDETSPTWEFQEGYLDYIESWKAPQTPLSWMKNSCVWYSQLLAIRLGEERVGDYLALFNYGNRDLSGGLTVAWLGSSLKISPSEQVALIRTMVREELPVSALATRMTRSLLFKEELPGGWKLFGKTGFGSMAGGDKVRLQVGWFVGWVESEAGFFPFAYNVRNAKIDLDARIPRVKELLASSNGPLRE